MRVVRLPLANYYRGEPAIQQLYREYVSAVDSILHPEYLSLAADTNLIRLAAPAPVYAAIVAMAGAAGAELRARSTASKLLVSVQVEVAWGGLQGGASYVGIAQDRAGTGRAARAVGWGRAGDRRAARSSAPSSS